METIFTPYSTGEKASRLLDERSSKGRRRQSNTAEEIVMEHVDTTLAAENLELCFPSDLQPGLFLSRNRRPQCGGEQATGMAPPSQIPQEAGHMLGVALFNRAGNLISWH